MSRTKDELCRDIGKRALSRAFTDMFPSRNVPDTIEGLCRAFNKTQLEELAESFVSLPNNTPASRRRRGSTRSSRRARSRSRSPKQQIPLVLTEDDEKKVPDERLCIIAHCDSFVDILTQDEWTVNDVDTSLAMIQHGNRYYCLNRDLLRNQLTGDSDSEFTVWVRNTFKDPETGQVRQRTEEEWKLAFPNVKDRDNGAGYGPVFPVPEDQIYRKFNYGNETIYIHKTKTMTHMMESMREKLPAFRLVSTGKMRLGYSNPENAGGYGVLHGQASNDKAIHDTAELESIPLSTMENLCADIQTRKFKIQTWEKLKQANKQAASQSSAAIAASEEPKNDVAAMVEKRDTRRVSELNEKIKKTTQEFQHYATHLNLIQEAWNLVRESIQVGLEFTDPRDKTQWKKDVSDQLGLALDNLETDTAQLETQFSNVFLDVGEKIQKQILGYPEKAKDPFWILELFQFSREWSKFQQIFFDKDGFLAFSLPKKHEDAFDKVGRFFIKFREDQKTNPDSIPSVLEAQLDQFTGEWETRHRDPRWLDKVRKFVDLLRNLLPKANWREFLGLQSTEQYNRIRMKNVALHDKIYQLDNPGGFNMLLV